MNDRGKKKENQPTRVWKVRIFEKGNRVLGQSFKKKKKKGE